MAKAAIAGAEVGQHQGINMGLGGNFGCHRGGGVFGALGEVQFGGGKGRFVNQ